MLKSLRSRLALSYVGVVVLSLLLGLITLLVVVRPVVGRLAYVNLHDKALPTARLVNQLATQDTSVPALAVQLKEQATELSVRILLVEVRGRVLVDTGDDLEGQSSPDLGIERPSGDPRYVRGSFRSGGEKLLYMATPVTVGRTDGVQRTCLLVVAAPALGAWTALSDMIWGFVWAGLVALVVAAILAILITRSLAKPMRRVAQAAHRIAQGDYDQRLVIEYPSEMGEVAEEFNRMAGEVKQSRQAMRDFVANVSHELKTPLTSIRGYAEAIVDGAAQGQAEQERAAGVIRDESLRMTRMVEQLLDLSRIESGQISMARNPVPVDGVLRACVEGLRLMARDRRVTLVCDCPDLPTLQGDADRLAQVFANLLDNALKHTPPDGKVTATGRVVPPQVESGPGWLEVSVLDTGTGIPAEELPRVFERFYQVDKSRARAGGGAGLGLAISKGIVEAHGGRIWAESVEGLGSKFVVRLPL